ncbi:right-handed parallel beta-helix repeat-containing protein, partial [uncultured Methanobrevibacter sp.]|uniref:right-handed parallel beta-helix repeat-containing protein n=1 Tax=uncultured Methanobrevibacter sp. TaxID=253161 RepID=UPI0025E6C1B9
MKYKKTMILLVLAIFIFGVASVCASDVNETTIATQEDNQMELTLTEDEIQTNENDNMLTQTEDAEILTSGEGSYSDLRNDINSGGNLTKSHYRYNDGDGDTIEINTPGVINGNGAVIDMAGSNIRTFYVSASGVTIKNLTIINANYNGDGGAIYFSSSATSGTVSNCNFTDNSATYYGGAVYLSGTGNVTNCNFTGNTANNGGAIRMYSGTVSNCNFTGNTATSQGGAIRFGSTGAVTNCNFVNDSASSKGGAVYFLNTGTVANCTFVNNSATGDGGAVYFYSTGTVTNCTFAGNNATHGGAVYFYDKGSVSNCNFINNKATGTGHYDGGGAVYFYNDGTVSNCNFTNNTAMYHCGAVYFNGTGEVTNCTFVNNSAILDGGAILMRSGSVENCNFTDNRARSGGGVYFNTGSVTNCNFINNKATDEGGAVMFENEGSVTNCNFTDNTVTGDGGAIRIGYGIVLICKFTNNSANNGGAIFGLFVSDVTFDTCILKTDSDTIIPTRILPPTLNVDNFTTFYGTNEKLTFDLKTNSSIPVPNGNISISVYFKGNNSWVGNYSCLSGEGWIPNLRVGSYYAIFDTEYAEFQPVNRSITVIIPVGKYYVNVTSLATNNKTVNITAKTNVPKNITWDGKLLFILPNGTQINATYGANGIWWAVHTFDAYG